MWNFFALDKALFVLYFIKEILGYYRKYFSLVLVMQKMKTSRGLKLTKIKDVFCISDIPGMKKVALIYQNINYHVNRFI